MVSAAIPVDERIVTIEDAAELKLWQDHVVSLEARPPNIEGQGAIPIRKLVINALRMRPDRIVVGECRGGEALDMLQAMNTGHDGSLTTLHANTARDALARLETLVLMAGMELPAKSIRQQVASAVNLIIQVTRMTDGTRKIVSIQEITGMEGDVITMQEIFTFDRAGSGRRARCSGSTRPRAPSPSSSGSGRRGSWTSGCSGKGPSMSLLVAGLVFAACAAPSGPRSGAGRGPRRGPPFGGPRARSGLVEVSPSRPGDVHPRLPSALRSPSFPLWFWPGRGLAGLTHPWPCARRRGRTPGRPARRALGNMSNSLKAGFSLPQAFELIAREMQPPIKQEFGLLTQEMRIGLPMEKALGNLLKRMHSQDLDLVVTSIDVSREVGGNLTEVFQNIAGTIRERQRVEGKIRMLSAQGRLQGLIMTLLPVFLMVFLSWFYPDYIDPLFNERAGWLLLSVAGVMLVIGGFVIHKILAIDI